MSRNNNILDRIALSVSKVTSSFIIKSFTININTKVRAGNLPMKKEKMSN